MRFPYVLESSFCAYASSPNLEDSNSLRELPVQEPTTWTLKLVPRAGVQCIPASLTRNTFLRELLVIEPCRFKLANASNHVLTTICDSFQNMVPRAGVEPATFSLGRNCSIQLSYRGVSAFTARLSIQDDEEKSGL